MDVLGRMLDTVRPSGSVLDLQPIRPNPRIELRDRLVTEIDGEPLFRWADAATAAVDARLAAGELADEAVDEHDVRTHYPDGGSLVEDRIDSMRPVAVADVPVVRAIAEPLVVRERSRLRHLRIR